MPTSPPKSLLGATLIIMTVTLMLISTLLILFATQYGVLQQKISANLFANQQAFEAAQAGIEAAIPYFDANYGAIVAGASGGYLTPYVNSNTQNVTLGNGSAYSFVFSNPNANNFQLITITATGVSSGGSSTRIIKQQIEAYATGMPVPTNTVKTQGQINLSDNATINNSQTNSNIVAGSSISITGSADTTTSSGVSSNSSSLGSDVQENNNSLANMSSANFFQSIFGVTEATMQSEANYTYTYNANEDYSTILNGITGAIIWINQNAGTARILSSTVIGSAAKPVILIVNGGFLDIGGTTTIYGMLFVLNPSSPTTIKNSATINGSIASTGTIDLQLHGALNYNTSVLNALPSVNGAGSSTYAKVPASWRDF